MTAESSSGAWRPLKPTPLTAEILAVYHAWPVRVRVKVAVSEGCWMWTASKQRGGYGRIGLPGSRTGWTAAHRYTYELTVGKIPKGMVIDHLCRTPACVRPDHLEPVTSQENSRRGKPGNALGWCGKGLHPWNPDNWLQGGGSRSCGPCQRERDRLRRPAKPPRTRCPNGHEYTPGNTYLAHDGSRRMCRACKLAAGQRWRERRAVAA